MIQQLARLVPTTAKRASALAWVPDRVHHGAYTASIDVR